MTLDEVRATLGEHREELAQLRVKWLKVFGSVARGEAGPDSDVDFVVEVEPPCGLFGLAAIRLSLCDWLGLEVDLVTAGSIPDAQRGEILAEAADAL